MLGQGLNLGLFQADLLCNSIKDHLDVGGRMNQTAYLNRFEREGRLRRDILVGLIDLLQVMYQSKSTAISGLRNLGLKSINQLPLIKRMIVDYAN